MKGCAALILILALSAGRALAQQQGLETSTDVNNRPALRYETVLTPDPSQFQSDVIVKKKLRVSGPLVRPFKAKKITEVPRRLLHLINPFARPEPKEGLENIRDLSPRAWTSIVGWHSGGSSFQDAVTHEPTMSLISVSPSSSR
jgi:hypothetical protein